MRFHTKGYDGKTRADIHADFKQKVPDAPDPKGGRYLLDWFRDINRGRVFIDGLPQTLTFTEIDSWMRVGRHRLEPHHVDALIELDEAYRAELHEAIEYSNRRRERARSKEAGNQ